MKITDLEAQLKQLQTGCLDCRFNQEGGVDEYCTGCLMDICALETSIAEAEGSANCNAESGETSDRLPPILFYNL